MARGITESDVHTAADEIVAGGERPTVERIRAHLGTGSPNTVTRWLETWWRGLGSRLGAHQRNLSVADAPEAVAILAGEWWELALKHARSEAEDVLAGKLAAVLEGQEALSRDRERFAAEAVALQNVVASASQAEGLATTRAVELQRLVNQLEGEIKELGRQRDAALLRASDADVARQTSDRRLQALADASRLEREGLAQHVRAIEDRCHREVDLARQEAKELRAQLAATNRAHAASESASLKSAERARVQAAEANQEAGAQRARADALEEQLAKLQDLPAALQAAWRQRAPAPKTRKSAKNKEAAQS
ncbi:DNA-binding protein [Luteimonas fraxinea]|uniref:DNA-binding protein n=1 Tax=Luteimonas fraxinea TaxID=2901869 RepID=UPI001E41F1F4|nr:DNA-binding protein [Luteimonas fraxinea]MCD9127661.1 DNA-binding protein [Luteimonas fraxinea]